MSPPTYPDFMRPMRLTPAELMRIPLGQGHHVVIADLNHPTGDALAVVADAMRAIKESGARVFLESDAGLNAGVKTTLDKMRDPKFQKQFLEYLAKGTLQDIEQGNIMLQAGRMGVPLLNHDHGYQQIFSDVRQSIPNRFKSLKIDGLPLAEFAIKAYASGANIDDELTQRGFKPYEIKAMAAAFETSVENRLNNVIQNDGTNASFVVANGGNGLTVSVIGNGHTAFTPSLQRELKELGKKYTNVTQISVFDSRDGFPPTLRDEATGQLKPEFSAMIGEHIYDAGTGTLLHIPHGSEARKHFFETIVPALPAKTVEEANRTRTPPPDRNPKDYEPAPLPAATPKRKRADVAPDGQTGTELAALPLPETRPTLRVADAGENGDITSINPAHTQARQPDASGRGAVV